MLNSVKLYIVLCLIGLQLIAPFIHAHAFGLDTFNERSLHIHADTEPLPSLLMDDMHHIDGQQIVSDDTNRYIMDVDDSIDQHSGYIITVASGVNSPTDADAILNSVLYIALLLVFALILLQLPPSLIFSTTPSLVLKQLSYPTQNPRAPPL